MSDILPWKNCLGLTNETTGRKKLKQLQNEIQRLTTIRNPNLLEVLAVKLTTPSATAPPKLLILSEQRPLVTLQDVLEDSDSLREERATVSPWKYA